MLAIGLMSGTSLDGIDCCLVKINENDEFKIIDFLTVPYTIEFREKLKKNLNDATAKLSEICELNFELGYLFKDAVDLIINKNNLEYHDISFIASHGQTIWHSPHGKTPSTLQIGESSIISVLTGIKVINNFRVADIVAGGEGAPLVCGFEYLFFKERDIILQNIGGIGNLTYIPKNATINEVIAFDTGPGNVMIDYFMNKLYSLPYDSFGSVALSGKVIDEVFKKLKQVDFVYANPPKSTGRELYSKEFMDNLLDCNLYNKNDIITTISEYTVYSIVYNYQTFIKQFNKVIVSGGGSHNRYIMKRLNEELNNKVITLNEYFNDELYSDAKEALAFAVLGYLSLTNRCGNVKNATGAKFGVVLGQLTLSRKE